VKWAGTGFRYDDGGWIFVHVEGEPYPRGRQYGELVAPELARYLEKLATLQDKADPEKVWPRGLQSWAVWKEGEVASKGFLGAERLDVKVAAEGS